MTTTIVISWIIRAIVLVIALSVHEFCHALAADKLGDPNPRLQGRLTLNPLKHLDPIGTIALVCFGFGWGKPVPFDPYNLKNKRRDTFIIAAAGPASNFLMAVIASLTMYFFGLEITSWLGIFLVVLIQINVMLAVFNLIPIYPLDGNHLVTSLLPPETAFNFQRTMRKIGPIVLFLLVFPILSQKAPIDYLISPIINFLIGFLVPSGFLAP